MFDVRGSALPEHRWWCMVGHRMDDNYEANSGDSETLSWLCCRVLEIFPPLRATYLMECKALFSLPLLNLISWAYEQLETCARLTYLVASLLQGSQRT